MVVESAASIQRAGVKSSGVKVSSVEAKTGLFAATRSVMVSELALPERFDAPMVTEWSPTAVVRPLTLPLASMLNPEGSPDAVNEVGPYRALTVPAVGGAVSP